MKGLLVGGDVLLEDNGLVARGGGEAVEDGLNLLDRHVETLGDKRELGGGVVELIAQDVAGDGGVVVDDEPAFSIEQAAARGEDGDLADAVGLGEDAVVLRADDLQAIEAGDEDGENGGDDVLRGVQLAGRDLLFAAADAAAGTDGRARGRGGTGRLPRVGVWGRAHWGVGLWLVYVGGAQELCGVSARCARRYAGVCGTNDCSRARVFSVEKQVPRLRSE